MSRAHFVLVIAAAVTLGVAVPLVLAAASTPVPASAAGPNGAGELSLDRGAVTALVAAQMPTRQRVDVPALGAVTLAFTPPQAVDFVDGGLQARIGVKVLEARTEGTVQLRLWPEVDAAKQVVRLRTTRAVGEGPLAVLPDFASLLPPIELPRAFDFVLISREGQRTGMNLQIQDVFVKQDRLTIRMGFVARPIARAAQPKP